MTKPLTDSQLRVANTIKLLEAQLNTALINNDEEHAAKTSNMINGMVWASYELLSLEDFTAVIAASGIPSINAELGINIVNLNITQ